MKKKIHEFFLVSWKQLKATTYPMTYQLLKDFDIESQEPKKENIDGTEQKQSSTLTMSKANRKENQNKIRQK